VTDLSALEARIARLEARNAIAELTTAYAVACDEHDIPSLSALFAEDAIFESPSGFMRAEGRDSIIAMFIRMLSGRGPGYHWTHDLIVRFDNADRNRATGIVHSHAETSPEGIVSLAAMKYEDEYRCASGRWLFAKRTIKFLYYVPADRYAQCLNSARRLFTGTHWLPADYPEELASWKQFEKERTAHDEACR